MSHPGTKVSLDPYVIDVDEVAAKSWKYIGYQQFSQFLASDNDFLVLRRFGALHVRILLSLQHEIVSLENKLAELDRVASALASEDLHNGTFQHDQVKERPRILKTIKGKLMGYDDFLSKVSHVRSLPVARQHDVDSVKNWLLNNNEPIKRDETAYLNHTSDLVPLVPKSRSSLRRVLERWPSFRLSSFWRTKSTSTSELGLPSLHKNQIVYTSDIRIETSLTSLILILGLLMLISPLWVLYLIDEKPKQLAIITGYLVAFTGLLSFSTVARPFESLAATAAYCAVLVVFLQIN